METIVYIISYKSSVRYKWTMYIMIISALVRTIIGLIISNDLHGLKRTILKQKKAFYVKI